jgi:hypothetical protein
MSEKLQEAVSLYNKGDKSQALKLLSEIVKQEPNNSVAWYGLSLCLDDPDKKIYCLKRVLSLDPSHMKAQQSLEKLQAGEKSQSHQKITESQPLPSTKKASFSWLEVFIFAIGGMILIGVIIIGVTLTRMNAYKPVPTPIPPTRTPRPSPTASIFTRDPIEFIPILPDGFYLDNSMEQINKTLSDGTRLLSMKYTNKYASTVGDLSGVLFYFNIFPNESEAISGYAIGLETFENEEKLTSQVIEIDGTNISTVYISSPGDSALLQGSIISRVNNIVITTVSFTTFDPQAFTETFFDRFVADIRIIHLKTVEKLLQQ